MKGRLRALESAIGQWKKISVSYRQNVYVDYKAVIDLPNRTETGSGFSGLARSVCRIRIQFHET